MARGRRKSTDARVLGPYARSDGTFAVVVRGPGRERWSYWPTKAQALREKREAERLLIKAAETPLERAIYSYSDHLRNTGRQESTVVDAENRLLPLLDYTGLTAPVCHVTTAHVLRRLDTMKSPASRKGTLARIHLFFQWCIERQFAFADPTEGIVIEGKIPKGKPTLTRVEARRFERHLWESHWSRERSRREAASALLLLLLVALRRGELLRLQVRDIDLESDPPVLSVERKAKTATSLRHIIIDDPDTAALLAELVYNRPLPMPVFPCPDSASGHREETWLRKWLQKFSTECGIKVRCPQALRATNARLGTEEAGSISGPARMLGHRNQNTTRDSYAGRDTVARVESQRALRVLRGGNG